MTKVIENGRFTSVVVEQQGDQFNIWPFDRDQREYEVFCNRRGAVELACFASPTLLSFNNAHLLGASRRR